MAEQGIMARKSVADIMRTGDAEGHQLSRTLGPFSITAMGIGAIIGAGIFVLTGTAAAQYAGNPYEVPPAGDPAPAMCPTSCARDITPSFS